MKTTATAIIAALTAATGAMLPYDVKGQDNKEGTNRTMHIHGTLRSKYEYQTSEGEGRFEVRNARVSVDGKLTDMVSYKA